MPKSYTFSESTWTEEQIAKWWELHKDDNAPRCGLEQNKTLTKEHLPDILVNEVEAI